MSSIELLDALHTVLTRTAERVSAASTSTWTLAIVLLGAVVLTAAVVLTVLDRDTTADTDTTGETR